MISIFSFELMPLSSFQASDQQTDVLSYFQISTDRIICENHVQNHHSIHVQRTARSSLLLIIIQHIVHKLVQLHVE